MKTLFAKIRTKLGSLMSAIKEKITGTKIAQKTSEMTNNSTEQMKEFLNTHNGIKDSFAGNVSNRFSSKIKKWFKNLFNGIDKKAENGSMLFKIIRFTIKSLAVIATIAFAGLVVYCIKDVFVYCLMLVATVAACAICIEFICSTISVATGCKI